MTKTQKPGWMRARTTWIVAGSAFVLVVGTTAIANAAAPHAPQSAPATSASESSAAPTSSTPTPTVLVETKTVTVDEPIPFQATTVDDPNSDVGTSAVTTVGRDGVKTSTFQVTLRDGVETGRTLVSEKVTTAPVDQVTSVGSRQPAPPPPPPAAPVAPPAAGGGCDPNYTGACVPIASDVDCAGGSGNGPAYVQGPVQVVGSDIYDLDRDGNGVGCE